MTAAPAPSGTVRHWSASRLLGTTALGLLCWGVVAAGCLMVGSTEVGWPRDFGFPPGEVFRFRLEMVLLASLVGAALGSAGVVYQAILRNPLADPYLLGVSSGASLAAYLWKIPAVSAAILSTAGPAAGALSEQVFAFVGALLAVAAVFFLASRGGRLEPVTLVLVGAIVNLVNGSVFLLINRLRNAVSDEATFLVGVIQTNLLLSQELAAFAVIGVGWLVLLNLSGRLNVATLSEGEAVALGVHIHRLRWVALVIASLITASAVAVSGPIGFIGLVGAHLARLLVGHDQRRLLPVATVFGASLLAIADAGSRLLSRHAAVGTSLPVGVLTGLLGGPFFLLLLWRSRRQGPYIS